MIGAEGGRGDTVTQDSGLSGCMVLSPPVSSCQLDPNLAGGGREGKDEGSLSPAPSGDAVACTPTVLTCASQSGVLPRQHRTVQRMWA